MRLVSLLTIALALAPAACVGPDDEGPPHGALPNFVSVHPNGVALVLNMSLQMQASSSDTTITAFSWAVSDTALASVTASGLLTARRTGNVTVRACTELAQSLCGAATITIVEPLSP